jgi:two-component system CheB/CheR fusion protein
MAAPRAGAHVRHDTSGAEETTLAARAVLALTPRRSRRSLTAVRYASAPAAVLSAALVQYALLPEPAIAPFVFFYFGIALVGSLAGSGPAIVATLIAAALANYTFVPPYMAWALSGPALTATALFVLSGGPIALLCGSLRQSLLRTQRIARELRQQGEDRKRDEAALRESEEKLREADVRKNEFLGVLSHELRNPLAPIRNSLYILGRTPPGSEQARRSLAVIERQVQQLARLTDDLLDVTRISRGKVRLQRERIDLSALVRRTAEDHRQLFVNEGIQLDVVVADDPVWVHADPTRIGQVIGNLLHNSAKFTPPGGSATLSLDAGEGLASITVRDSGVGIAPDVLTRLFEPFVQADSTLDRSTGGLGLGLALVKGLVELHGGSVSARSDGIGKGATFVVELALDRRRSARLSPVAERPSEGARRVLLVEDNADAALSMKEALEMNGHEVDVAYSGPEGLDKARTFRPEVILCDIGLPTMNGFQVARALRADPQLEAIALIALSGYAQPEDIERSREAGFDLHLAKPVDVDMLQRMMAEVATSAAARGTRLG